MLLPEVRFNRRGSDVVAASPGETVLLRNFVAAAGSDNPPLVEFANGQSMSSLDILSALLGGGDAQNRDDLPATGDLGAMPLPNFDPKVFKDLVGFELDGWLEVGELADWDGDGEGPATTDADEALPRANVTLDTTGYYNISPSGQAELLALLSNGPGIERFGVPILIDILGDDAVTEGGNLALVAVGDPLHGRSDINDDGSVTYIPEAGFSGNDRFEYTVADPDGRRSTAQVEVSVKPEDGSPLLFAANAEGVAGSLIPLGLMAKFPHADDNTTEVCEVTICGIPDAWAVRMPGRDQGHRRDEAGRPVVVRGSAKEVGAQIFALGLDVPANAVGHITLDILARQGKAIARETCDVAVSGAQRAGSRVADDVVTAAEDTALTFNLFGDNDGHGFSVLSNSDAVHGEVSVEPDGTVRYVPQPTFTGKDSFDYTAQGADGSKSSATVTINVTSFGDKAKGRDRGIKRKRRRKGDGAVAIALFPEGDTDLVVTKVEGPHNGRVVIDNLTGIAHYTPNADFCGSDWFVSTVFDRSCGASCSSLVTVNVSEIGAEAEATPTEDLGDTSTHDGPPTPSVEGRVFSFGPRDIDGPRHTIRGFQPGPGGDVIDLSALLLGVGPDRLREVVRLQDDGYDTTLRIVWDDQGSFRDLAVVHGLTGRTLAELIADGNLRFASGAAH